MEHLTPDSRVELLAFADDLGLTPQEVRAELAGARLGFSIDDDGCIFTTAADVLRWCQQRVAAVALFGQTKVGFPLYPADWQGIEFIPGPAVKGFSDNVEDASPAASKRERQEAERE